MVSKASSMASYTKYSPATSRAKLCLVAMPLKKPVTNAVWREWETQ